MRKGFSDPLFRLNLNIDEDIQNLVWEWLFQCVGHGMVLCQEKAQNKVSDDIEKGRRQGCGKRGKGP